MKTRYYTNPFQQKGVLLFCLLTIFITGSNNDLRAQIAAWNFENIGSAVPDLPIAPSSKDPRVRASATLSGGNNNGSPDACSGNESWSTNFWPTGSSRSTNAYIQFSVKADPGESFEIDRFSFRSNASSSSSALKFSVYYSKNNFTTSSFLFSGTQSTGSCSSHGGSVGVNLNPGTTIRFRIYPYGQNVAAQAATIRIDNVSVTGSLLPVTLSAFNAAPQAGQVVLNWTTATEINNDHFKVERSPDGIHFQAIGQLAGLGNSQVERDYHFTDPSPFPADNYYRLRQVDYDGTETVHSVVHVFVETANSKPDLVVWPTVVSTEINTRIKGASGDGPMVIRSMQGQLIRSIFPTKEERLVKIPVNDLPTGWYVLQYRSSRQLHSRRFFKS